MVILTKTDASSSFSLWTVLIYFWQNVLQLSTVLMRLFDYLYNNDLVICKDSPDYRINIWYIFSLYGYTQSRVFVSV